MGNHPYNFVFLGPKVKAPVPTLGKPALLALPLGKKPVQGDVSGSEDAQIPVHGQNIFTLLQGLGNSNRNSFLSNATEPLGNLALP